MITELTDQNFDQETNEGVVITDFWATWCGPCKMQSPVLEKLADEMDDVKFTKMDVDENPKTPQSFGIMAIPTLLIKKDGEIVDKIVGFTPKEKLEEILNSYAAPEK